MSKKMKLVLIIGSIVGGLVLIIIVVAFIVSRSTQGEDVNIQEQGGGESLVDGGTNGGQSRALAECSPQTVFINGAIYLDFIDGKPNQSTADVVISNASNPEFALTSCPAVVRLEGRGANIELEPMTDRFVAGVGSNTPLALVPGEVYTLTVDTEGDGVVNGSATVQLSDIDIDQIDAEFNSTSVPTSVVFSWNDRGNPSNTSWSGQIANTNPISQLGSNNFASGCAVGEFVEESSGICVKDEQSVSFGGTEPLPVFPWPFEPRDSTMYFRFQTETYSDFQGATGNFSGWTRWNEAGRCWQLTNTSGSCSL